MIDNIINEIINYNINSKEHSFICNNYDKIIKDINKVKIYSLDNLKLKYETLLNIKKILCCIDINKYYENSEKYIFPSILPTENQIIRKKKYNGTIYLIEKDCFKINNENIELKYLIINKDILIDLLEKYGEILKLIGADMVKDILEVKTNYNFNYSYNLSINEYKIFNESVETFIKIIKINNNNFKAKNEIVYIYNIFTFIYNDISMIKKKLPFLLIISQLHDDNPFNYYKLACSLEHINEYNFAIVCHKKTIEILKKKESIELLNATLQGLFSIYNKKKEWRECLLYSLQYYKLNPSDIKINFLIGTCYDKLGKIKLAENNYKSLIEYYKNIKDYKFLSNIYTSYALLLYNMGNSKESSILYMKNYKLNNEKKKICKIHY